MVLASCYLTGQVAAPCNEAQGEVCCTHQHLLLLYTHICKAHVTSQIESALLAVATCVALGKVHVLALSSSFLACNSRLCSAIRRHHPPQRAVLSQICCFGEHKVVSFQILLDGAEPHDAGTTSCLFQSAEGEANRILLASVLSSMHIICPNRVRRRDWFIAVSLGVQKSKNQLGHGFTN